MSTIPIHPRIYPVMKAADGLAYVAREITRAAAAKASGRKSRKRGGTLRPGENMPLWNALVLAVKPLLKKRGEKIKLGRIIGVPPQRIHEYFVARTASPDAERTLMILWWLRQRVAGFEPG